MALYAAIDNGTIVARREIADWETYPAYKKNARDERGDGGPSLRPIVYEGSGPSERTVIAVDRVTIVRFTPDPTRDDYAKAIQAHVDATAAQRGYETGVSCAGYASSTIAAWAAEAMAFIAWRDRVWSYAFTQLALVKSGQRAQPAVVALIAELPAMEWPS